MAEEATPTRIWVDWAFRIVPLAVAAAMFFASLQSNQTTMLRHDSLIDAKIIEIERMQNLENREMVERLAKSDAAVDELKRELEFYLQTRKVH